MKYKYIVLTTLASMGVPKFSGAALHVLSSSTSIGAYADLLEGTSEFPGIFATAGSNAISPYNDSVTSKAIGVSHQDQSTSSLQTSFSSHSLAFTGTGHCANTIWFDGPDGAPTCYANGEVRAQFNAVVSTDTDMDFQMSGAVGASHYDAHDAYIAFLDSYGTLLFESDVFSGDPPKTLTLSAGEQYSLYYNVRVLGDAFSPGTSGFSSHFEMTAAPEPASMMVLVLGIGALLKRRK